MGGGAPGGRKLHELARRTCDPQAVACRVPHDAAGCGAHRAPGEHGAGGGIEGDEGAASAKRDVHPPLTVLDQAPGLVPGLQSDRGTKGHPGDIHDIRRRRDPDRRPRRSCRPASRGGCRPRSEAAVQMPSLWPGTGPRAGRRGVDERCDATASEITPQNPAWASTASPRPRRGNHLVGAAASKRRARPGEENGEPESRASHAASDGRTARNPCHRPIVRGEC